MVQCRMVVDDVSPQGTMDGSMMEMDEPSGWHKSRALEVGVSMRLLSLSLVVQTDDGSDELLRANSTHLVDADGAKLSGEQAKTQKY